MRRQDIELSPETDNEIDVNNLKDEFTNFSPMLNRYCEAKAQSQHDYGIAKAEYEEIRSEVYIELKTSKTDGKMTEKHLEAAVDIDSRVRKALRRMLDADRDLETIKGYVESMRAKKDMLIQLGADARKES